MRPKKLGEENLEDIRRESRCNLKEENKMGMRMNPTVNAASLRTVMRRASNLARDSFSLHTEPSIRGTHIVPTLMPRNNFEARATGLLEGIEPGIFTLRDFAYQSRVDLVNPADRDDILRCSDITTQDFWERLGSYGGRVTASGVAYASVEFARAEGACREPVEFCISSSGDAAAEMSGEGGELKTIESLYWKKFDAKTQKTLFGKVGMDTKETSSEPYPIRVRWVPRAFPSDLETLLTEFPPSLVVDGERPTASIRSFSAALRPRLFPDFKSSDQSWQCAGLSWTFDLTLFDEAGTVLNQWLLATFSGRTFHEQFGSNREDDD